MEVLGAAQSQMVLVCYANRANQNYLHRVARVSHDSERWRVDHSRRRSGLSEIMNIYLFEGEARGGLSSFAWYYA